jgi:hypothetical protein
MNRLRGRKSFNGMLTAGDKPFRRAVVLRQTWRPLREARGPFRPKGRISIFVGACSFPSIASVFSFDAS